MITISVDSYCPRSLILFTISPIESSTNSISLSNGALGKAVEARWGNAIGRVRFIKLRIVVVMHAGEVNDVAYVITELG